MPRTEDRSARKPRGMFKRLLLGTSLIVPALVVVLWVLANHVPWVGPLLADSLRRVVGDRAVAQLENVSYGIEDHWNRLWRGHEKPRAYWTVPASHAEPAPQKSADANRPAAPRFDPKNIGPMHKNWSAPGDGVWVAIDDPRHPGDSPRLYKTLLHPDRNRSWAELFVVAIDVRRTRLQVVAGTREPQGTTPEARSYQREGLVPEKDQDALLAAFNGGFKAEHGHFGMMVDGVTLLPPRPRACTIAMYNDDSLRIGTWKALSASRDGMRWWRQTPGCMYENGKMHIGLEREDTPMWGATLDGDTVIRRSAIGLSADRKTLYVGISNHTTARAIAEGMHFAGAESVAQLDVNWSYPKFVLYRPGADGKLEAVALADGFAFRKDEYIRHRSRRDFFYIMRKQTRGETAEN